MDMCKKIGERCTTQGEQIKREIRKVVWSENDNDIQKKTGRKEKRGKYNSNKILETQKLPEKNELTKCMDLVLVHETCKRKYLLHLQIQYAEEAELSDSSRFLRELVLNHRMRASTLVASFVRA